MDKISLGINIGRGIMAAMKEVMVKIKMLVLTISFTEKEKKMIQSEVVAHQITLEKVEK